MNHFSITVGAIVQYQSGGQAKVNKLGRVEHILISTFKLLPKANCDEVKKQEQVDSEAGLLSKSGC